MNIKAVQDSYCFECKKCGECCTGSMPIYLNLFDLYNICDYLKLDTTYELFSRGLVKPAIAENGTWIPQIQFRKRPFKFCPFLINDVDDDFNLYCYCRLHPHLKPLTCKLSPIGRVIDCTAHEIHYIQIPPAEGCPGVKSEKICRISDIEENLKQELDYDYRFFMILDSIISNSSWTGDVTQKLYYFSIRDSFDRILQNLEQQYRVQSVV